MVKKFFILCYLINVALLCLVVLVIIAAIFNVNVVLDYVLGDQFLSYRMIINIPIILLWIYNLVIWSRKDKHVLRFFLLFFLNAFYNPFYFRKALKSNWI